MYTNELRRTIRMCRQHLRYVQIHSPRNLVLSSHQSIFFPPIYRRSSPKAQYIPTIWKKRLVRVPVVDYQGREQLKRRAKLRANVRIPTGGLPWATKSCQHPRGESDSETDPGAKPSLAGYLQVRAQELRPLRGRRETFSSD